MCRHAILIGEGVFHRVGAAVLRTVDLRQLRNDRVAAAVGHCRRRRARHTGDALHLGGHARRDVERLRGDNIDVFPDIFRAVHRVVVIVNRRVAGCRCRMRGVIIHRHRLAAHHELGRCRRHHVRQTEDVLQTVRYRRERAGDHFIHMAPLHRVGAHRITVGVGNRTLVVGAHRRDADHLEDARHLAARIRDDRRSVGPGGRVALTGNRIAHGLGGHQRREVHGVGKRPDGVVLLAVLVTEDVLHRAVAVLDVVHHRGVLRSQGHTAGILHHRQGDAFNRGGRDTLHRGAGRSRRDGEIVGTMDLDGLGNRGIVAADIRHRVASCHRDHTRGVGHRVAAADGQLRVVNAIVADGQAVRSQLGNGRVGRGHHTAVAAFSCQFRQRARDGRLDGVLHNVGIGPRLGVCGHAILIGEGVFHRVGAAVLRAVDLRQRRDDRVAAAVGHRRGRRAHHVGDALHLGGHARRDVERLRGDNIDVFPDIFRAVHRVVVIVNRRVAGCRCRMRGVIIHRHRLAAHHELGRCRRHHVRQTEDVLQTVRYRRERAGNHFIHMAPLHRVGAYRITVGVGNRTLVVGTHRRDADCIEDFCHIAARIRDGRRSVGAGSGIAQTSDRIA